VKILNLDSGIVTAMAFVEEGALDGVSYKRFHV
jgi:hypothetical protein